ncbi:uncharacterized protein [Battus philenor]|uniref:uncharacterized protein n=1 Tax=Battus philenor TaxID=42288 RepID=UPI0035CF0BFD
MTLIGAILKKAKSQDTVVRKYRSPPPEMKEQFRSKKKLDKYDHIKAVVDSRPPRYDRQLLARDLPKWRRRALEIAIDNTRLVMGIKMAHFKRGKVDCHWKEQPPTSKIYHENRVRYLKEIQRENKSMYKRIVQANPRVESTATLQRAWQRNREEMLQKAQKPFIIFPPVPRDLVEDVAFCPLSTGKRIRVYLTIGFRGGAVLGELKIELFKDICPATCRLFLELMDGDQFGYGYVGTRFFR